MLLLPISSPAPSVSPELLLPLASDTVSILAFKSHADLDNKLHFSVHERFDFCTWQGVSCTPAGRVLRFSLPSRALRGTFPPNSLSRLDQLRILILRNNSLSGPIPPDISRLGNLKTLVLEHNLFSGSLPPSLFSLYKLRVLNLSFNNFSGPIPIDLNRLDRLLSIRLEFNRFSGPLPPLNQSGLEVFNVSSNNLTGEVPKTPTLLRFHASSFFLNPNLCGEVLNTPCNGQGAPFFNTSSTTGNPSSPTAETSNSGPSASQSAISSTSEPGKSRAHKRKVFALGLSFGTLFLFASIFCFVAAIRSNRREKTDGKPARTASVSEAGGNSPVPESATPVRFDGGASRELMTVKEKKREREMKEAAKSGKLVFSVGETEAFTMEQLMRASAEMLGRGNLGTTYKAKLDNHLVVTVKRLDATRTAGVTGEAFDRHMERVGALRHPNLVPVRAYFQAKQEERLIIYDYQPNGSVFNLVHGSRSTRTKPLHWTSCLKIAEDVAQGLTYIHQASKLIHGNLKAANILLGPDFEACVTDYCLYVFTDSALDNTDPDSSRYKAPEIRHLSGTRPPTIKSDVYAFGVLLIELLSGKPPSEHPFVAPPDLPSWVRAMRDHDGGEEEDDRLEMLVDVAGACSLASPEQRPTMSHVLKMIQRIKNSVIQSSLSKGSS